MSSVWFNLNFGKSDYCYQSLLANDAYEVPSTLYFLNQLPTSKVIWKHTNRSANTIKFAHYVPEDELQRQFDHASSIRFTRREIDYLASLTDPFGGRLVDDKGICFFRNFQMGRYLIGKENGEYKITIEGLAHNTSWNESPGMAIMTDTMSRARAKQMGISMEDIYMDADRVLDQNIALAKTRSNLLFSEFGFRRGTTIEWHSYVVRKLTKAFAGLKQYVGTSRLDLSMELGTKQIGTIPHKVIMNTAAWYRNNPEELKHVQAHVMRVWNQMFPGLKTMLSDTYPSMFWEDFMEFALNKLFDTVRPDSGNPFVNGEEVIAYNQAWGTNIVPLFSDAVDIELAIKLLDYFIEYFVSKFGLGSVWSCNNTILTPMSHVIKPWMASCMEGYLVYCIKHTMNSEKTMGDPEEVIYYNKTMGYRPENYPTIPVIH